VVDDELERPTLPWWVLAVLGLLALVGLVSLIGWILGVIGALVRTAVLLAVAGGIVATLARAARR
jgi:hypothetical protein